MSCPDLDTLLDPLGIDDAKSHLESCADCQRMVEMVASIGGGFNRGSHCDDAELLIAALATGGLKAPDDKWLTEHLGDCRHCAAVARSVLLDPPAPEIPKTAPLTAVGPGLIRIAIPIAAVAAVAVFLAVLFTRGGSDDAKDPDAVVATAPVEAKPARTPDAAAAPRTPDAAPPPELDAAVEPAGPDPEAVAAAAAIQREARAAIQAAVRGGSLADAFAGCEKVRGSLWVKKCVVLACRAGNKARSRRYLSRLPKRTRGPFINLCLAKGVEL